MKDWLVRANAAVGITGYLVTVAFAAGLLLALALLAVSLAGLDRWALLPLAFLGLFISVDAAITLVNRVVTDRFGPAVLPGLELRDGVSNELRTIVVMPTLLTTAQPSTNSSSVWKFIISRARTAISGLRFCRTGRTRPPRARPVTRSFWARRSRESIA